MLFQLPSNIKPSVPSERIQESTNRSMEVYTTLLTLILNTLILNFRCSYHLIRLNQPNKTPAIFNPKAIVLNNFLLGSTLESSNLCAAGEY